VKFLHLSDLHIGLRLLNRDLGEDQDYILKQIIGLAIEEKPDAVVIAGDIYDKSVGSAEGVALFDRFISGLSASLPETEIMIISGNHDSPTRLNLFRSVLADRKIHMIGLPPQKEGEGIEKVTLYDEYGPVNFYLLPFVKPSMVRHLLKKEEEELSYDQALHLLMERETIQTKERNVLVSHQFYLPAGENAERVERAESELRTVGNIDRVNSDLLLPFDYAALGHIHKPMKVGGEVRRYCGTPIACSFSEAGQKKSILKVELGQKGNITISELPLKPLREVRILKGELDELLREPSEDYVTVVLTDKVEFDAIDLKDRLWNVFPNMLELRRDGLYAEDYIPAEQGERLSDPLELCHAFLGEITPEEEELLRDLINSAKEAEA